MRLLLGTITCILIVGQTACVAVDSRINKQLTKHRDINELNGQFLNKPIYRSERAGFLGPADFADTIEAATSNVEVIRLKAARDAGLVVILQKDGKEIFEKTYRFEDGLEETKEGVILLPRVHMAGNGGPGVGYGNSRFGLFINDDGNLVVIQTGGAGGLIGILPFAMYTRLMSVFPRRQ